ncbi:MAG TPA: hypothetical protein VE981_01870 [Planctomycetota bacterium]|nr:hypothetical protein [Planctomycetota bacterium]
MMEELRAEKGHVTLYNRPDLVPRLAAHFTGPFRETASLSWSHLMRNSPLKDWGERLADTRVDFLAWSLDHPYESPLRAISSTLPPSEDLHRQRLVRWDEHPTLPMDSSWSSPDESEQWKAFRRILSLLERRGNRVLVVLGPMNEHMMDIPTRTAYGKLKAALLADLAKDGVRVFAPSLLDSAHYADICHPLGPGYDSLARELLLKESAWMLGLDETR